MRNFNIAITILLILFIGAPLIAQDNCYYKADGDIQQVYQYYMGISLRDGIEQYLAEQHQQALMAGEDVHDSICDISIEVNKGRGFFIGQQNLVEVSIRNSFELSALYLGLEFLLDRDKFNLVEDYGNSNLVIKKISQDDTQVVIDTFKNAIYTHPEVFTNDDIWPSSKELKAYLHDNKYDFALGGIFMTGEGFIPLPTHFGSEVFFSFLIELPDSIHYTEEELCFDNVFIPPAGTWSVSDRDARDITPDFNGHPSADNENPDAPPVCFKIIGTSETTADNSDIHKYIPELNSNTDQPLDFETFPGINSDSNGNRMISVQIKCEGNENELGKLGKIGEGHIASRKIIELPLDLLPRLCQLDGVYAIFSIQAE